MNRRTKQKQTYGRLSTVGHSIKGGQVRLACAQTNMIYHSTFYLSQFSPHENSDQLRLSHLKFCTTINQFHEESTRKIE
jgi:ribosomal protein L33